MSDSKIRKTNEHSAQEKLSDAELVEIQNELDVKIQDFPAELICSADEMGTPRGSWTASWRSKLMEHKLV